MQGTTIPTQSDLADQLSERFGPLLTQGQLAELLGRSKGGLRYSLCAPRDEDDPPRRTPAPLRHRRPGGGGGHAPVLGGNPNNRAAFGPIFGVTRE